MTDTEIIEWLQADEQRLQDLYWRLQNEEETLREAAAALCVLQAAPRCWATAAGSRMDEIAAPYLEGVREALAEGRVGVR